VSFLDSRQLAEVENVQFESADGTEIEGFIYKPPGFNENFRYPTLLRIHGGPVSQYDFNFNFDAQLFAANGYVVVMTNPRVARLAMVRIFRVNCGRPGALKTLRMLWQA
jgi:dipeptidyl aminopeptidase/acylaminoacyl peptidase